MKKYIIVVVFFIHQIYSSQIKMKVKIIEKREVYINKYNKKTPEYLLQITLDNQSKKDYIIPIDTTGYRTYMLDNKCNDFFMMDYYPDLGITPKIYKENFLLEGDGAYLQGRMGDEEWNRRKKEQERRKNKKKKEAKLWMKKYKIKGTKVANGLMMLISQAIKSEEIWHNEVYGAEIIEKIHKKLSEKLYK